MATSSGIRVEGARELRASLKKAGDDMQDLRDAHTAAVHVVVPAARAKAPVLSGRLAGSVRGSGSKTVATIRAGGATVPYAAVQHWGWRAHGIEAHPFMSEGAQDTEPVWSREYMAAVDRIVAKIHGLD